MIFSRSVRAIFANRAGGDPPTASAMDIEAITRPPRFPG
jgi:hypothetical protein